jgi:hypothetical protein
MDERRGFDMSETAQELVDRMVAAGEWPEPALLQAIADKGAEAVEPLLAVIRADAHGWPAEAPLDHALGLLTHLPRSDAVLSAVSELFRRYDNEILEILPDVLVPYGPVVIEPLLEVIRNRNLRWYASAVASNIALHVAFADAEQFARVKAVLRQELADLLGRGKEIKENDLNRISSHVVDLAEAADPEARPLIDAALAADLSEMMNEEDVKECYRDGPTTRVNVLANWLDHYRKQYEDHQRYLRERDKPKPKPIAPPLPPRSIPSRPPKEPVFRSPPIATAPPRKIGRNDPCWCGSGKKYKNCHLHQDQG